MGVRGKGSEGGKEVGAKGGSKDRRRSGGGQRAEWRGTRVRIENVAGRSDEERRVG